jgi:pimeloyl-ACP methyl ester carboxylesterase
MTAFVLVHSPLVGPFTWALVGDELRRRSFQAVVPALRSDAGAGLPYWQQHVDSVVQALEAYPSIEPPILVGHSGAGVLLPAIRQALGRAVSGYLFVDASIPRNAASRLGLFASPEEAAQFRQAAVKGLLPTWTEADLCDALPNDVLRQRFVAELRPLPLAVYEEPIPVFEGWSDAPCGYLRFTGTGPGAYEESVQLARREGWAYTELDGGHFHMLVDPLAVANALVGLARQMGINLGDAQDTGGE